MESWLSVMLRALQTNLSYSREKHNEQRKKVLSSSIIRTSLDKRGPTHERKTEVERVMQNYLKTCYPRCLVGQGEKLVFQRGK